MDSGSPSLRHALADIPVDRSEVPQQLLNLENKVRTSPLPWKGQFSPEFVEALLRTYANRDSTVLDPFAGSGTVLLEGARRGIRVVGAEVNPAAFVLARTYLCANQAPDVRTGYIRSVERVLQETLACDMPLLGHRPEPWEEAVEALVSRARSEGDSVRGFLEALVVLSKPRSGEGAAGCLHRNWSKLRRVVAELPFSTAPLSVLHADARTLPIDDDSVDLVVTSPPYINVYNYHQQYRKGSEALGWDVLRAARSEIGSNRKHRGNRFLTVIQYCMDMLQVLNELRRVCKTGSRVLMIAGRESRVRGVPFWNAALIGEVAVRAAGFVIAKRQERAFLNRYGATIVEDIVHLVPAGPQTGSGREVAREIGVNAVRHCPTPDDKAVQHDLLEAIRAAGSVNESPPYISESAAPNEGAG